VIRTGVLKRSEKIGSRGGPPKDAETGPSTPPKTLGRRPMGTTVSHGPPAELGGGGIGKKGNVGKDRRSRPLRHEPRTDTIRDTTANSIRDSENHTGQPHPRRSIRCNHDGRCKKTPNSDKKRRGAQDLPSRSSRGGHGCLPLTAKNRLRRKKNVKDEREASQNGGKR